MKKIVAIIMAFAFTALSAIPSFAAECEHNFLRTAVSANCIEKGHTAYLCRKCGYSYKVYNDEYTAPEGLYILAKSERVGSTLTVTVDLFNNPGLTAGRLQVGYNASTLRLREFINGDVWTDRDYTGGINTENNPLSIFTEDYTTGLMSNQSNGRYFTLVFDILDPDGEYNMYFSSSKGDFHSWNQKSALMTYYTLTVVSLVGKSELGDHGYIEETTLPTCTTGGKTEYTCEFCGDHYVADEKDALGHNWEHTHTPKEPTLKEEGLAIYTCSVCKEWKTESIPVLEGWAKGDLNGDGTVNSIDANLMKRMLVGFAATEQALAAADVNGDGNLNSQDANALKRMISGN